MADAFRGLTLRLGADARPVNSAISSITRTASAAQSQLNKLNKALKFDQGNVRAMAASLDLVGDKSALAARGLVKTQTAMRQASAEAKQLASRTSNVYAKTQQLNSQYNHVNANLQHIYDAAKKAALENEKWAKITTWEKANKWVNALRNHLDDVGAKGKKARAILMQLIQSSAYRTDITDAFGLGNSMGAARQLIKVWDTLRAKHKVLEAELGSYKEAEGLRALKVQALSFAAELRRDSEEAARMRSELYALGSSAGIAKAVTASQRLDSMLVKSRESARSMTSAFHAMPSSVAAATMKLNATASEVIALRAKMGSLVAILDKMDGHQFDKLAAKTRNVWAATDKAEANFAQVEEKIRRANAALELLNAEFDELNHGAKNEKINKRMEELHRRIQNVKAALISMTAEQNKADAALSNARAAQTYRETYEEIQRVKAALAELQARASVIAQIGRTMRTAGYGLYSTLTPTLMILGRYAINAANDVDEAYRNMRKTVNGTELEFEHLRQAALEFGRTHVTSASQILEIESIGGQLGIAVQNLEKFSEVVSNTDIATNMDTETISENFGQLSNIMRDMNQDLESGPGSLEAFSDALVRLGNNSAAQEDKIMKVMMRVASIGTISRISTPDLLALSTAVAAAGQGSEAAGTAISRTFSQIEAAVGKGGKKLETFARVAGYQSAKEFSDAWNNEPMKAFTNFINGLKIIDDTGGSVANTLSELGINAVRQRQTLMNLTNTTEVLANAIVMSNDAWNGIGDQWGAAGDAAREASRKAEGFSGQLQMAKNAAQELGVVLLDSSVPMLQSISGALQLAATALSMFDDTTKTSIVQFAALTAAAGPVLVMSGALIDGITKISSVFQGAISTWKARKVVFTEIDAALAKNEAALERVEAAELAVARASGVSAEKREAAIAALAEEKASLEADRIELYKSRDAAEAAAASAGKFKGMLKTIGKVAGFMVLIDVITKVIAKLVEAKEKADKLNEATVGLAEAANNFASSARNAGDAADNLYGEVMLSRAEKYATAVDDAVQKNIELKNAIEENQKAEESSVGVVENYVERLSELNGECHGNAEYLAELKSLVAAFNKTTGASVKIIDEQAGALSVSNEALSANVELLRNRVHLSSAKKNFDNASATYIEQKNNLEKLNREFEKYQELSMRDNIDQSMMEAAGYRMLEVKHAIEQLEPVVAASKRVYEDALVEMTESDETYKKSLDDIGEALGVTGISLEKFVDDADDADEALQQARDTFSELLAKFPAFNRAFGNLRADTFLALLDEMGMSIEDVASDMDDMVKKVSDGFSKIETDSEMSLNKYIANLQHNIQVTRDWGNNIEALYNKSADEVYQAWVKTIADAGPEQAALVADMVGRSTDELVGYAYTWQESIDAAAQANMQALKLTDDEAKSFLAEMEKIANSKVKVEVTDDGSIKVTEQSLEYLDMYEIAKKGFIVTDDGSIINMKDKCESLKMVKIGDKRFYVTDDGTVYDTKGKITELVDEMGELKDKTIKVNADTSQFDRAIADIASSILEMGSINIPVGSLPRGHAAGAISWDKISRIPMNASGAINGIVTRPTLTNIGWTGEAGAEAILHMKNAGGMVVPLTNRRYVRPFAHAVASEMPGSGNAGETKVYNIYFDNARLNDDAGIRDATMGLLYELSLKGEI